MIKKTLLKIWIISSLVIGFFGMLEIMSHSAWAARTGRVVAEFTQLQERPLDSSKSIRKVKKGTPLVASNFATENYHKVRLGDGTVGWVKAVDLTLGELPEEYR